MASINRTNLTFRFAAGTCSAFSLATISEDGCALLLSLDAVQRWHVGESSHSSEGDVSVASSAARRISGGLILRF
jgi:hypothetical protein